MLHSILQYLGAWNRNTAHLTGLEIISDAKVQDNIYTYKSRV